jgi:hypothetical protein
MPFGKQIFGVRRQNPQQVTIPEHYRQVHDTLRQDPTVYCLPKVDGAPQQAVNLPLIGVSGVGKRCAQQDEIAVRFPPQRSNEPERE